MNKDNKLIWESITREPGSDNQGIGGESSGAGWRSEGFEEIDLESLIGEMLKLYTRFPDGHEQQDEDFAELVYTLKRQIAAATDEMDTKLYNMGSIEEESEPDQAQQQLLQAIRLLINHLNDRSTNSDASVEAGLMELRELI